VENLYYKTECNLIHFENVSAFDYLAQDLKKRGLAVQTMTPSKDKVTRLREIESYIQDGTISFVMNGKGVDELISQILLFPNSQHDDLVDAFVLASMKKKKAFFIF